MKYRVSVSGQTDIEAADPFEAVQAVMGEYIGELGSSIDGGLHVSLSVYPAPSEPAPDES